MWTDFLLGLFLYQCEAINLKMLTEAVKGLAGRSLLVSQPDWLSLECACADYRSILPIIYKTMNTAVSHENNNLNLNQVISQSPSPPWAAWGFQRTPPHRWTVCRCGRWCGSAPPCRRSWHTGCSLQGSWCSHAPGRSPSLGGKAASRPARVWSFHGTIWVTADKRHSFARFIIYKSYQSIFVSLWSDEK